MFRIKPLSVQVRLLRCSRCSLKDAELYGRVLTCADGHYEVWEEWQAGFRPVGKDLAALVAMSEYEEWPRGRVVHDPNNRRFILHADAQILRRSSLVKASARHSGLPPDRT